MYQKNYNNWSSNEVGHMDDFFSTLVVYSSYNIHSVLPAEPQASARPTVYTGARDTGEQD